MDNKESMQNNLKNLEERLQNINQILDKGNDTVVIQIGSQNIRYGLGSQWKPSKIRNMIAYRQQNHQTGVPNSIPGDSPGEDRLEQQLQVLEGSLRKRGNIKQDYKNYKIKQKAKQELNIDRYDSMESVVSELQEKQLVIGEECSLLRNHPDYVVKTPIKQQNYNLECYESVQQCMQDLTKILEHVLFVRMGIKYINNYNLILVINDNFNKGFVRSLIDIFLQEISFRQVYCHLESVCASFGGCLQYACVVNIGAQKVNVNCVEEGLVVANTQISKNYGSNVIEVALQKLIQKRKQMIPLPDQWHVYEQLKERVCSVQQLEDNSNKLYKVSQLSPEEEDGLSERQIHYSDLFCVASNVIFDQGILEALAPAVHNPYLNKVDQQLNSLYNEGEPIINLVEESTHLLPPQASIVQQVLQNAHDPNKMSTLDDLVCYSLSRLSDPELKRKMAMNIVLIGGGSHITAISDELQDRVIDKIHLFDHCIEQIDCIDVSSKEVKPEDVAWAGATILSKIEGVKDLWISRNKYLGEINNENNIEMLEEDNKKSQEIGIKALREKLPFQW